MTGFKDFYEAILHKAINDPTEPVREFVYNLMEVMSSVNFYNLIM